MLGCSASFVSSPSLATDVIRISSSQTSQYGSISIRFVQLWFIGKAVLLYKLFSNSFARGAEVVLLKHLVN